MGTRLRSAALVALATLALVSPSRAATPVNLVVAREDGALLRVSVGAGNAVTSSRVLMPGNERLARTPAQVARGIASVAVYTYDSKGNTRTDSLLVDPRTGRVLGGRKDGKTGQLFVSPDGRTHYAVLADPSHGGLTGVVRTDSRGRNAKVLVPPTGDDALSGVALSYDGRTLYVAVTTSVDEPSVLYAVNTATGAKTEVSYIAPYFQILNVVVSPDGRTLALSLFDPLTFTFKANLLDLDGSLLGVVRPVDATGNTLASSFTADGRLLLSQWDDDYQGRLAFADPETTLVTAIANSAGLQNAWPVP